jgi:hypothetical protein
VLRVRPFPSDFQVSGCSCRQQRHTRQAGRNSYLRVLGTGRPVGIPSGTATGAAPGQACLSRAEGVVEAQAQVRQVLVPCAHSEDVMGGWERASYQERNN